MRIAFNRLFNLRSGEWPQVLLFYGVYFAYIIAFVWGQVTTEALLLSVVGVEVFPAVLMVHGISSFSVVAIYTALVDRIPNRTLLIAIFILGGALIAVGRFLLGLNALPLIIYPFLYIAFAVINDLFSLHWWTFVNSYYDTRSARRTVPIIATGSRIGWIIGSLSLPLLNRLLPLNNIILIYSGVLGALAIFSLTITNRLNPVRSLTETASADPKPSTSWRVYIKNAQEGLRYVIGSRFLLHLALGTLLIWLFSPLLEYRSREILVANIPNVTALSNYLSLLNALASTIFLPIQLFLFSRLVNRFGLGTTNLIYPLFNTASTFLIVFMPRLLFSGALGYLNDEIVPTERLLYNAVPVSIKGRANAFITGLVSPLASLIGSGFLVYIIFTNGALWIPFLLLTLSIAYLLNALLIRREYGKALVQMLQEDNFTFLWATEEFDQTIAEPAALALLKERLRQSQSDENTLFVVQMMSQIEGSEVVDLLVQTARTSSAGIRAAIIDLLADEDSRENSFKNLCLDSLNDADAQVRRAAVTALSQQPVDESALQRIYGLLQDSEASVQASAVPLLIHANQPSDREAVQQTLENLLHSPTINDRLEAIYAVKTAAKPQYIGLLLDSLEDEDEQVRMTAAEAVGSLKLPPAAIQIVFDQAVSLAQKPTEHDRTTALLLLSGINNPYANNLLVDYLADPAASLRHQAVDELVKRGSSVISLLTTLLDNDDLHTRLSASSALVRIRPIVYRVLLDDQIDATLKNIYEDRLQASAFQLDNIYVNFLYQTLQERARAKLDDLFFLLASAHDAEAVRVIQEGLSNPDTLIHANAVEALEALTNPRTARLIAPLFVPESPDEKLARLADSQWNIAQPTAQQVIAVMHNSDDPWLRALAGFVTSGTDYEDKTMLSVIERVIFLKEVPFFRNMTVDQLKILAGVCEEAAFAKGAFIFKQGDAGGILYIVVSGRVSIEQEGRVANSATRLATLEARAYFGEMSLFDSGPRSASAITQQETITLLIRREPMLKLIRQQPDLSLEIITILNDRLRKANDQLAQAKGSRPRALQSLFDELKDE